MEKEEQFFLIALSLARGIGPISAKRILSVAGSAKSLFSSLPKFIPQLSFLNKKTISALQTPDLLTQAKKEHTFITKHKVQCISFLDENYPTRLKHCDDGPILLYKKGPTSLNPQQALSIVGTRKATRRGVLTVERLVDELVQLGHTPCIISGLAYGIDIAAHKAALNNQLPTIAILGHGLHTIYPASHKSDAREIARKGALITDFASSVAFDRNNFLRRNRIIAGMADATLVIESAQTGGALITATMANGYNRDVFAVPGHPDDLQSKGCNHLIKSLFAQMVETGKDIADALQWNTNDKIPKQTNLFETLSKEENNIAVLLKQYPQLAIDEIAHQTQMPMNLLASSLLELEFKGIVVALPGKIYKLKNPLWIK